MNYENMTRRRVLCFQNQQTKARFFQTMGRTGCKISCSPYHDQIFLFHLRCLPSFVSAAAVFFRLPRSASLFSCENNAFSINKNTGKDPFCQRVPVKNVIFLLFQTTSETTHRRLRGLLVQTSGTASGILFPPGSVPSGRRCCRPGCPVPAGC